MIRRTLLWAAATTAFLPGCTTVVQTEPTPLSEAKQVPAERLLAYQRSDPGTIPFRITRDTGGLGSSLGLCAQIAGINAAILMPGESAVFHVPPGKLELAVVSDPRPNTAQVPSFFDVRRAGFEIAKNHNAHLRIVVFRYSGPFFVPHPEKQ